jgi:hypothetical protein
VYQIALEKMGINNTRWKKDCCREAVILINEIGFNTTTNANTLMNWIGPLNNQRTCCNYVVERATSVREAPPMLENPDCPPT